MTTSDLHSRMYAMPSNVLNQQQQTLMQKLHSMPDSPITGTFAPNGRCSSGSGQTSASWLDPYITRTCYLLRNPEGRWLADVQGSTLVWTTNPDDAQVYGYERTARQVVRELRELGFVQRDELQPISVQFYAHKARAHLWSAAYV